MKINAKQRRQAKRRRERAAALPRPARHAGDEYRRLRRALRHAEYAATKHRSCSVRLPHLEDHPRDLRFQDFALLALAHGVTAHDMGGGRWQVRGPLTVDYWPGMPGGPLVYVHGTTGPWFKRNPERAIACALQPPPMRKASERARKPSGRRRPQLYKALLARDGNACHWCGYQMRRAELTLDHVIPRARGGANRQENLVLACRLCNASRSDDMPELSPPS